MISLIISHSPQEAFHTDTYYNQTTSHLDDQKEIPPESSHTAGYDSRLNAQ